MKITYEKIGLLIGAMGIIGNTLNVWSDMTEISFVGYGGLIFIFADKIRKGL